MLEKLKIKSIYDDFLTKVSLTDEEIAILDMLIKKEKIIKISLELGMSERTVKYKIKKIKELYNSYWKLEVTKFLLLME